MWYNDVDVGELKNEVGNDGRAVAIELLSENRYCVGHDFLCFLFKSRFNQDGFRCCYRPHFNFHKVEITDVFSTKDGDNINICDTRIDNQ